jgi:tetratricopeptide (TPR) repeat protein
MLTGKSISKFQLKLDPSLGTMPIVGIGGSANAGVTKAREFSLVGFNGGYVYKDMQFVVYANSFGSEVDGLIGQNILGREDVEFDLANGAIRVFRTKDCNGSNLAYWHGTASVAQMSINVPSPQEPHLIGEAKINGEKIRVMFDTGSSSSFLSTRSAARLGIKPQDDDVVAGGTAVGIGKATRETWIARFDSLDLGGEVIKNARLLIGDLNSLDNSDLLLGADFFLAHRIYVSPEQRKIFFTYNGGPVFDLRIKRVDDTDPKVGASTTASNRDSTPASSTPLRNDPTDAAGLRRRAAASVQRLDFVGALADLDRAISQEPTSAETFYQRAMVYWRSGQVKAAEDDLSQALVLKPDYKDALMYRGSLRLQRKDEAAARADFDALTLIAQNDGFAMFYIALEFQEAELFEEAITRINSWIAAFPKHERLPLALNLRCWSRAMLNQDLDLALTDCNAALKKGGSKTSQFLDSRGAVYLRLGQFDKSIADYNSSLTQQPKKAWSLYGRGLAKIGKGLRADGEKDIEAALAIDRHIAEPFKRVGFTT